MTAGGTRMSGGTSWSAAYADLSLASGDTIDLGDDDSCEWVDRNGSNRRVCGGVQTFFVPRARATNFGSNASFHRYQIRRVSGATRVVRSECIKPRWTTEAVKTAGCEDDNGNPEGRNSNSTHPT